VRIVRETNPDIISRIKDHFIEDGSYTRDIMAEEFRLSMTAYPDSICVLVGYDKDKIVGLLIAFRPYNRNYVLLDQVWSSYRRVISKEIIEIIKMWSREIGASEIRASTSRNSVAQRCIKDYGFKEQNIEMTLSLSENNDG